jgi:hypothetical protein
MTRLNCCSAADLFFDLVDLGLRPADILARDAVSICVSPPIASTPHLDSFLAGGGSLTALPLSHLEFS